MVLLKNLILIIIGYSSGIIIAGGIFAFIAIIGIIPRFAQKTRTKKYLNLYEDTIVLGGIFGATTMYIDYNIPGGNVMAVFMSFFIGIFIGCLAVSLAEVMNVVPIFMRRTRLKKGLPIFITALAIGKLLGSLLYFLVPNFYLNK